MNPDRRNPLDGTTDEWTFGYRGYVPADEGTREALCAVGNGLYVARAVGPESQADGVHYPGTYAAGLYDRLVSEVEGRQVEHESLANVPNWLPLSFRPRGGDWLDVDLMHVTDYHEELDLRAGVLSRHFEVTDANGRTTAVDERRLVHMGRPHLAALSWELTAQNWSGPVEIRSALDGGVENRNVTDELALAGCHLAAISVGEQPPDTLWLTAETVQSRRQICVACRTSVRADAGETRRTLAGEDDIAHMIEVEAIVGNTLRIEKTVALATSLDDAIADVRSAALIELDDSPSVDELVESHALAWGQLWRRAQLSLRSAEPDVARTLNLHTFHMLQTLSPHIVDRDVGVPARGLHGEGYRGHVFWDELFIFPYLNLRFPELTKELLLYRYRRLPAARRMARAMGRSGARYPWQSGSDGREETPTEFFNPRSRRWMDDNSQRQHHVSLAVAVDVWQYHQATDDIDFLADYGAEMLVEIARFWADLAELDPATGRYSIAGVMGPDEFHDGYPGRPGSGIVDNAYTNVLVSWLLRRAIDVRSSIERDRGDDLWERLKLGPSEVEDWDRISRNLRVPFHEDGLICQFAGYAELRELDWADYRRRYENIGRLDLILEAEGDNTNDYKLSKQADVLMLLYLFSAEELADLFAHLGYRFDPADIPRTIDYYTARMSHGSTLSRVVVAWVLARRNRVRSWEVFCNALQSDVADIQGGTTREGVHLGAMAGTIDLVQRCYAGIRIHDDILWLDPRLPDELDELAFPFRYRGHQLDVTISGARVGLCARPGRAAPITVDVGGARSTLAPGGAVSVELN